MNDLQLVEIAASDAAMLEHIGELRVRAWRANATFDPAMRTWRDEWDRSARHWAVLRGGEPVAAARFSVHTGLQDVPHREHYMSVLADAPPAPVASLNRLVVDPSARGLGLSKQLDDVRLSAAEAMGCRTAVGVAHDYVRRIRPLEAEGFVVVGEGRVAPPGTPTAGLTPRVLLCRLPRRRPFAQIPARRAAVGAAGPVDH
jgi:GNAT superfamily N-acetyltransferase